MSNSAITMTASKFVIGIMMVFAIPFSSYSSCSKLETRTFNKKLLLVDTDAGGDDAVAILMALTTEKFYNGPKVIGITCVNGNANANQVALNVLKTLKVANRLDIPVYIGASHPLLLANRKDYYFGKDGFGDFHYPDPPSTHLIQQQHAVITMIELVKKHPGKITLVALGPLTNIALAIRLYPTFLDNLHQLIIMGGSVEGVGNASPGIEFNFAADPGANYIVFNSSTLKPAILVPWETVLRTHVTMKFRMSLSESNNKKAWLIDSANSVNLNQKAEYWYCADAVAMAVALTSGFTVTKSGTYYSEAIYYGSRTSGLIIVDYTNITGIPGNTNIIQGINERVYKELLLRSVQN